eukprot:g3168.t1
MQTSDVAVWAQREASNTSAFSAHRGGQKVPTKNSFTPQLFKTFSQNDMTKRKKAHAASARRSLSMGESLNLQLEPEPSRVQNMVRHPGFDLFFTVVVITNSIFIGVELQLSVAHPKEDFLAVIIQYLYTLLFTGELVMRVVAEGRHFLCASERHTEGSSYRCLERFCDWGVDCWAAEFV